MTVHDEDAPTGERAPTPRHRPPLRVPTKDSPLTTGLRLAREAAHGLPRTPSQLRQSRRRFVDKRLLRNRRAARGLIVGWQLVGRATQASTPAQTRFVDTSQRLAARMTRSGKAELASQVLDVAEHTVADAATRNPLAVRRAVARMNAGHPDVSIDPLIVTALANADAAFATSDLKRAAANLQDAFDLAFHRVLHFEDRPSKLAADPAAFLEPFHRSSAFAALGSTLTRDPVEPPTDRPHRLLFVTASNFNFATSLIDDLSGLPDVDVRAVNLLTQEAGPTRLSYVNVVNDRLLHSMEGRVPMPDSVAEELEWADTIFVEWGHRALAWISSLSNLRARVVVRLHSYEAMTQFPLMTNWGGVHDVVFVSDHIRRLVEATVPQMLEASGPRIHTIPNRNEFGAYLLPKKPGAEFTLGLVGWGQVVKDPLWALEVLELLRAHDSRYTLRLLGNDFAPPEKLTRAAAIYRDALHTKMAELGDAVHRAGYSTNMPQSLRRVGIILSSSHREGTHEGFLEGCASGAFPVARNWPFVEQWGGAHSMVPDEWVVTTPAQAAERILAREPGARADEGVAAASWVREHYDWSVVGPRLRDVVLGTLAHGERSA